MQRPSSPAGPRAKAGAQTRKDSAYRHIQSRIVAGQLAAGEVISELSLARDLGISRTPIREAIGQLVTEGFLEQVPGRGTVVKRPKRSDIIELYELREALEVYAVGKVAGEVMPAEDVSRLESLCEDVRNLARELETSGAQRLSPAQMERFIAADLHFHLLLLRAAGNRRLLKVVRDTRLLIRIFAIRREGHSRSELEQVYAFHRGILAAVCAGDAVQAVNLLGEHIRLSRQERIDNYDRWERMTQIELHEEFLTPL